MNSEIKNSDTNSKQEKQKANGDSPKSDNGGFNRIDDDNSSSHSFGTEMRRVDNGSIYSSGT